MSVRIVLGHDWVPISRLVYADFELRFFPPSLYQIQLLLRPQSLNFPISPVVYRRKMTWQSLASLAVEGLT